MTELSAFYGSAPGPVELSPAWWKNNPSQKEKLRSHILVKLESMSQRELSEELGVNQVYISQLKNKHWDKLHAPVLKTIAVNSGFMPGYYQDENKPETSVQYHNTKQREREVFTPEQIKDIEIINRYLEKRKQVKALSKDVQKCYIQGLCYQLINSLKDELNITQL